MVEIDKEMEFMTNLYKRAQSRGYNGTFKQFLEEIYFPITNYRDLVFEDTPIRVDVKGLAEMFKLGVEAAKVQTQTPQQPQDPLATYKVLREMMKPIIDEFKDKWDFEHDAIRLERMIEEEKKRLRALSSEGTVPKIPDPLKYVQDLKSAAEALGFNRGLGQRPEAKLELTVRVPQLTELIELEKEKIRKNQEAIDKSIQDIKDILSGPVGQAIDKLGKSGQTSEKKEDQRNKQKKVKKP